MVILPRDLLLLGKSPLMHDHGVDLILRTDLSRLRGGEELLLLLAVVEVAIQTKLLKPEVVLRLVGVLSVLKGEISQVWVVLKHLVLHKFLVISIGSSVGMAGCQSLRRQLLHGAVLHFDASDIIVVSLPLNSPPRHVLSWSLLHDDIRVEALHLVSQSVVRERSLLSQVLFPRINQLHIIRRCDFFVETF